MKKTWLIAGILSFLMCGSTQKKEWTPLLDKDLTNWEMYLSYRHQPGYKGEEVVDKEGKAVLPIGYNKNVNNVFSILQENGEPVLRISGEIYGCVFTKQEFENYHLKLKFKWGTKKWNPRLDELMDSGILYHSQGECGVDYWKSWMLSQEFQLIEGGNGDYWSIANSQIKIPSEKQGKNYKYSPSGEIRAFGEGTGNSNFCQAGMNAENPKGEWSQVELICFDDKSIYLVNGKVVMALSNSSQHKDGKQLPLTKGKIQLQSEAAEVYFKEVQIKNIQTLPEKYRSYFK